MTVIVAPQAFRDRVLGIVPAARVESEATPELLAEAEVVFGSLTPDQITAAPNLRWLQTMGAGVNGLTTPEVLAHPVVITNASGIHAEPITEHMFAMTLAVVRNLPSAWDDRHERRWDGPAYASKVGMLAGRTLGVLGVGAIGGHSATVGKAFGMAVIGLRRTGEPHPECEQMYTPHTRMEFFSRSDVVFNTLPLTEATRGFVGREELAAMPEGAMIANTGRGATIDTAALLEELRSGRLSAALLDVTDPEPLPPDHPLWAEPRCHITAHYAGFHPGYMERAGEIFLDNLRRYTQGRPLRNVVDKREGY